MNDYDVHYANHNVLFLWNACREIATGIGAQSAGVVLGKAFKLKLMNDAWSTYFKEVRDARRAFRRLNILAEQLEGVLWNAIFMRGMSAEGNTILRTELDKVMWQQVWPDMDALIGRWTVTLTAKDTTVSATAHGTVQTNVATNQMQRRKLIHKNTKCINCGKPGHMFAQCEEALSKCTKCSGSHHTSMHEDVQNLRKARDERIGRTKQKKPDANSPKERMIKLALNAKAETEPNSDEYDAQLDAMIAIEESMNEKDETQPTFIDEDGYGGKIYIGGTVLSDDNMMYRLAVLDAEASSPTEEETVLAMKALRVIDDEQDEVIFDTGCTAHVLR
jgi:hypothetical protein